MDLLRAALERVELFPSNRVTDDSSVLTLKNLAFEPLLEWDRGFVKSALFSHWTQSGGGRRWEFFIRPGAVFHDGAPCRPEHILEVIDGVLQSVDTFGMKWSYARYLAQARIAAGAANSITVDNPGPFADILDIFSEFHVSRLAPDGAARLGTGLYRIAEYAPRQRAVLVRTEAAPAALPERIELIAAPKAEARYDLLQSGAADVAMHLQNMETPPVQDARFQWDRCVSTLSVMYYLNCFSGVFASPEARLAANLAIDQAALAAQVYRGLAVPSSTIVSPWHLGMARAGIAPVPFDTGRARSLLDRAGGPRDIKLRTPDFMPERAPEISRFTAASLEQIGFRVTIETEHDRPEYARQVGRKEIGDLAIFDSSPDSTYRILNDKISSAAKAVWWQGFDDAETERLIAAANTAIEPGDRENAYAACLRRLNAAPPWLYVAHPLMLLAARPGAGRLALTPRGTLALG